jgi:deoxyribonuclease-4
MRKAPAKLLFGTAGVPHSAAARSTEAGSERVAELGLGCMEIEFVQRVSMGPKTAESVRAVAERLGISLSAHAPYYINLNAHEPEKQAASRQRILQTARIAWLCGAQDIVVHAAFNMGDPPPKVYETVKRHLRELIAELRAEGNQVRIRIELMGRPSQFGSLDEVLALSAEVEGVAPCLDFAHMHARTGAFNSYDEFISILKRVEERLGRPALDDLLVHVSGIAYTKQGERQHLVFKESDFRYQEFVEALKDCKAKGSIICESPNLEEDALLLQQTYRALS